MTALGPSPAVAIAWDVNKLLAGGRRRPTHDRLPTAWPLVRHLHVKPNAAGNLDTIADSPRSYRELLSGFAGAWYSGAASIEHWGSPEMMLEGIRQLRSLREALA